METTKTRVRYAPSPTGQLHIGGARTALFNYLFAKKTGGEYILRIEDTDQSRNVEKADEKFLENFEWMGLLWDEGPDKGGSKGPYRCMERLGIYEAHIQKLVSEGKAYLCFCSKEELEAQKQTGPTPKYSGKCACLTPAEREELMTQGKPFSVRFKVPQEAAIEFRDLIRGDVKFEASDIGDFVILKTDGIPPYNFAVAVDDALMEITHVIRGEEHLSNTPRQLLLYDALGFSRPQFAHVSLILNQEGKKLSKRDLSTVQFIEQYRNMGYLPEAIINYLALLGWSPEGENDMFSPEELIASFSLDRVSKAGAKFDMAKLASFNSRHIKASSAEKIAKLAAKHFEDAGISCDFKSPWYEKLISLLKDGVDSLSELPAKAKPFFESAPAPEGEAKELLTGEHAPAVLSAFAKQAESLASWDAASIKDALKAVQKETGHKGKPLMGTVRAAATGELHGPDLPMLLELFGKEKTLRRIENAQKNA